MPYPTQGRSRSIEDFLATKGASLETPYYLIDEQQLFENGQKMAALRERSGAKCVLALKCFSTWSAFRVLAEFMDGATSSSLFEARLGHEKFGKEVHAYSVAFTESEIQAVAPFATKIIFNSVSQLRRFQPLVENIALGLRVNPGVSVSGYDLADPGRQYSRLGVSEPSELDEASGLISGVMFHCNCENASLEKLNEILAHISRTYGDLLHRMKWVSLGGGIAFTHNDYPFEAFCQRLREFSREFDAQVYLEPGDAAVTQSGYLVARVLDIVHNDIDVAIVDAGAESHMLDLLTYRMEARLGLPPGGAHRYMVAGRTCLAGDVFGTYMFPQKLRVGSLIPFADAAGYTVVKKNWFNGIAMPSIVVWRLDGSVEIVKTFGYDDFLASLS